MSFAARPAEQLYRELADAEEHVAALTEAVAAGRISPARLDLAVWRRDHLRREIRDRERRGR